MTVPKYLERIVDPETETRVLAIAAQCVRNQMGFGQIVKRLSEEGLEDQQARYFAGRALRRRSWLRRCMGIGCLLAGVALLLLALQVGSSLSVKLGAVVGMFGVMCAMYGGLQILTNHGYVENKRR